MLFNSATFLLFLPAAFAVYWAVRDSVRAQNLVVVVASYVFYGWWDWRFLLLIAFISAWSYAVGLVEMRRWERRPSKLLLAAGLAVNLGILGYFKYCDFCIDQAVALLNWAGMETGVHSLGVVLPVGISFYTFQALSYTIDIYRRQVRPTRDPVAFFAFISFFPQLVAGPIERASNLLPQFLRQRTFDYPRAVTGCRQMLWGFFKKMVVADNCAAVANAILNDPGQHNGLAVWVGLAFFAVQVYGDFSGYSDIAIGCARLFGIDLMRNFAYPYFARDIAEFWRRWHMSLTTWFRDYLYIPLGGSRCSRMRQVRNTFAIFLVSGLWHGADWTFVLWGVFHAALFLPLMLAGRNRRNLGSTAASGCVSVRELGGIVLTDFLVIVGWAFFRAQDSTECARWFVAMLSPASWTAVRGIPHEFGTAIAAAIVLFSVEWLARFRQFALERVPGPTCVRWAVYISIIAAIVLFAPVGQSFIYFQF